MMAQKQPMNLNQSIVHTIANNRVPMKGIQPLLDFLSFNERRGITAREVEKYFYRMAGTTRVSGEYEGMLKEAVAHPKACLTVISQLLRRKTWTEDERYAGVLVDTLDVINTPGARRIAEHAALLFLYEHVPIARQRAEKLAGKGSN
jgi:hypothetical protein